MTSKEAINYLKQILDSYEPGSTTRKALEMAITALELQDGNLYLRDVKGPVSIGIVKGNVYTQGYPATGGEILYGGQGGSGVHGEI